MRIGRTKAWLLGLAGLLALPAPAAELSFRERLDACIEAITENLGLPKGFVFQRQAPEAKDAIRLGLNIPFYSAPPVTGPLGFVRAVGIGIPEPTDYNELKDWVHTFGTVDQQKNFLKICFAILMVKGIHRNSLGRSCRKQSPTECTFTCRW